MFLPRRLVPGFLLLLLGGFPTLPAATAAPKVPREIQKALEQTMQDYVKQLLEEKDEQGAAMKRCSYSRRFRKVDEDTYRTVVHVDTAGKEKLLTERKVFTLARDTSRKNTWEISSQELEATYDKLIRSVPGDETFMAYDSLSVDQEGLTLHSGPGSLYVDTRGGETFMIVLSAPDLSYAYEPPVPRYRALYDQLLGTKKSDLDFSPERLTIYCTPGECARIMNESIRGAREIGREDLDKGLGRAYDDYLDAIEDARKKNAFSGFRRPWEEGDRYLGLSVKKQGADHYLGLEFDNREPREVSFWASGMGILYRYHSAETRAAHLDPTVLERRPDYDARTYEMDSLVGTVEMGFGDGELLTGDITFGLTARRPLRELPFAIQILTPTGSTEKEIKHPRMNVNSITSGAGEELTWVRTGAASGLVILPREVAAGERFSLEMEFESSDTIYKFTPSYSYVSRGGWLPFVRFGDMIDEFDLTVKVPSKFKVLGIGKKVEDKVKEGTRTTRWIGESPVEFPTVIFGDYLQASSKVKATRLDGTEIPVTMNVDRVAMGTWGIAPKALQAVADEAANSLNLYREIFGVDYPYARLDLVNDPLGGLYGQAPSSLVYLGSASLWSKGVLGSIGGAGVTKFVHSLVAHEVAHQWWGSVVANANDRNYWFVESLAEYSSSLYVQAVDGVKGYLEHVQDWRREILDADIWASVQDAPVEWAGDRDGYRASLYAKGPYFFHILRSTWGDEKFFAFLKELARDLRGKEIVTRDIQQVADKSFGIRTEPLFDEWIRGVGIPEYTLSYSEKKAEDGSWIVEGTIDQRVLVGHGKLLLKDEYYDAMVPVTVLGRKSGYKKNLFVSGPSTAFTMKVPEEPKEVILNRNGEVLAYDIITHRL